MVKGKQKKEIAYEPGTISIEDLPYPIVHYPSHYGCFLGFKKNDNSQMVLCSCFADAIEKYVSMRLSQPISKYSDSTRMYVLDSHYFPIGLVKLLISKKVPNNDKVLNYIKYEDKLCHECNKTIPKYRYCSDIYGGVFKQNYGWYIIKRFFENGIDPISYKIFPELCPNDIKELIKIDPDKYSQIHLRLMEKNFNAAKELDQQFTKQKRKIWSFFENEVRSKFGHKNIGEAWTSETILYYIIKNIFSDKIIYRHFRPKFLKGLELDIFIEDLNLGIEYQGIQHFKPVKHWGGKKTFEQLKKRDKLKKDFCKGNNVELIYFIYDENLSKEYVFDKIKYYKKYKD